jgi:hypothetical protein
LPDHNSDSITLKAANGVPSATTFESWPRRADHRAMAADSPPEGSKIRMPRVPLTRKRRRTRLDGNTCAAPQPGNGSQLDR